MAMSVVGFEVDSERGVPRAAERLPGRLRRLSEPSLGQAERGADGRGGRGDQGPRLHQGAVAIAIAAVIGIAIIAVIARWAPADLIMDDAIGFSVIELAELTNVDVPTGGITKHQSPQDLEVVVTPLDKIALTYREFREYVADDEDSRYEVYLRYNRIA